MKLKAPQGVGNPCVAGMIIAPRDGVYEVGPAVGALLIECFGFVEVEASETTGTAQITARSGTAPRRRGTAQKT